MKKGFTLFVAILTMGTLLLIAAGIANMAVRQSFITSSVSSSAHAFYAADSGIECVLFWDVQNPSGISAFATSSASNIFCNRDVANPTNEWSVGGADVSSFDMTFLPDPYCAHVTVTKSPSGETTVESLGYNTCDPTNNRRLERAVRAIY